MTVGIIINILFFFSMGLSALIKPISVVKFVKLNPDTVDARNEVRAVYGGFGIAVALALWFAADNSEFRSGVIVAIAVALIGMAVGRIISAIIEKPGMWPVVFVVMESALAALLLISL